MTIEKSKIDFISEILIYTATYVLLTLGARYFLHDILTTFLERFSIILDHRQKKELKKVCFSIVIFFIALVVFVYFLILR